MKSFKNYIITLSVLFSSWFIFGMKSIESVSLPHIERPIRFAVGGYRGHIMINEIQEDSECRIIQTLQGHYALIRSLVFDYKRGLLFSGSDDTTIRIWKMDNETGQFECFQILDKNIGGHEDLITSLIFDKKQGLLISSSHDETKTWKMDNETGQFECIGTLCHSDSMSGDLVFDSKRRLLFTNYYKNRETKIYKLNEDTEISYVPRVSFECIQAIDRRQNEETFSSKYAIDFSKDTIRVCMFIEKKGLFICGSDQRTTIWKINKKSGQFECHQTLAECCYSLAFDNKEDILFSGHDDGIIKVWKINSADLVECIQTIENRRGRSVISLIFDQKNKLLFSYPYYDLVKIWQKNEETQNFQCSKIIKSRGQELVILDDNEEILDDDEEEKEKKDMHCRLFYLRHNCDIDTKDPCFPWDSLNDIGFKINIIGGQEGKTLTLTKALLQL